MAKPRTKRSSKPKQGQRAKPSRGAIAAANVGAVGDAATFNLIREMYDQLAESRGDTQAAKRSRNSIAPALASGDTGPDSTWITLARGELGQRDYPGPRHNPRVIEYLNTTSFQANDDETSWCSAFVNWCMLGARLRGTNNAAARSWLTFGQALSNPRPGCIVILWRESPSSWKGHVGFFEGFDVGIAFACWAVIKAAV